MAIYIIILSNIYCGCKDTCVVISTNVLSMIPSLIPHSNKSYLREHVTARPWHEALNMGV